MKKEVGSLLLAKTGELIKNEGIKNLTMRSVASCCHLSVSNIYNYYSPKDEMIDVYFYHQWLAFFNEVKSKSSDNLSSIIGIINAEFKTFISNNRELFEDNDTLNRFMRVLNSYEPSILSQFSDLLLPLCNDSPIEDKQFLAETVIESVLQWTIDEVDENRQKDLLYKIFLRQEKVD
ncbi:MAG: hypothetical protein ACI4WG_05750 [Erysipelotrichaceae bacterium]